MRRQVWFATAWVAAIGCAPETRRDPGSPWGGGGSIGSAGAAGTDDGADDGGTSESDDGGTYGDESTGGDGARAPAAGIAVSVVEANQGVAVTLADEAGEIAVASRNAELVTDRALYFSAGWALGPGFEPRTIEAHLELRHQDGRTEVLTQQRRIDRPADLSRIDGAFAWRLEAGQIDAGLRYRVSFFEVDDTVHEGATTGAVFPRADTGDLGLRADPMTMTVVLVPVHTPGGVPNLGPQQVAQIEERLLATFPLQHIDLRVRAPWVRQTRFSSLDDAFGYMSTARVQDGEGSGAYYHLVVDAETCCMTGGDFDGWIGIANLVEAAQNDAPREGITKVSYEYFEYDIETIVHELGHNHGRSHAPCGFPDGVDPAYPYANAGLGVRGYDLGEDRLIDPVAIDPTWNQVYADFMSYCGPSWWSDYSWRALTDRAREVGLLPAPPPDAPTTWRLRGLARRSGDVTWSWVRSDARPIAGRRGGTLRLHGDADEELDAVAVRVTRIADTDLELVEADVTRTAPDDVSFAALELQLDDGRWNRSTAADVHRR